MEPKNGRFPSREALQCTLHWPETVASYANGYAPLPFGGHRTTSAKDRCRGSARRRAVLLASAPTHVVALRRAGPTPAPSGRTGGLLASAAPAPTRRACPRARFRSAPSNPRQFVSSAAIASRALGHRRVHGVDGGCAGRQLAPVETERACDLVRSRSRHRVLTAGFDLARELAPCHVRFRTHDGMLGPRRRTAGHLGVGAPGRARRAAGPPKVRLSCFEPFGTASIDPGNRRSLETWCFWPIASRSRRRGCSRTGSTLRALATGLARSRPKSLGF